MNKVFVIGFHKTVTTSLEHALQYLGYQVYGGDKHLIEFNNPKELNAYILNILETWDAVQDMAWPLFYKELYELYPDAKFILTTRETSQWIKSVVKFFASIRFPLHRQIYNVPCAEGHEQTYIDTYNNHNASVRDFFRHKSNYIEMEPGRNFDYQTLCEFLEISEVPDIPFPYERNNKKRKLPNYKFYRDFRSMYWNYKKNY